MAWNRTQTCAIVVALVLSCASGWGYIKGIDFLAYLGAFGAMAMFLVNGAHGGNAFGAVVFIIVNSIFYYTLTKLTFRIWRRIRSTKDS